MYISNVTNSHHPYNKKKERKREKKERRNQGKKENHKEEKSPTPSERSSIAFFAHLVTRNVQLVSLFFFFLFL